jgi:tetratricopeptide (TPR) repeat protein
MTIKTQRLLARAKKNAKKGEIEKARKSYLAVLKDFPNNQEANKELSALNQSKKTPLTKEQLDVVIQLYSSGQIEEALSRVETLIKDYPSDSSLFNISGACYMAIGQLNSAVKSFENAITHNPGYAEAQYNLGFALQGLGQFDAAMSSYKKAIAIKHAFPAAHNNMGLISLELHQLDSAVEYFKWAVAYNSDFAEAHNNLGATLQEAKNFDEAIKQFEKAVTINPNYAQAHNNLGILCQTLGQQDVAIKHYEKAISIKADYTSAHHNLSSLKKYTANDNQVSQMQSLLTNNNLVESERVHLCFALAKVYDDLGNHDEQFKVLNEGNYLRKEELNYSLEKDQEKHLIYKKLFSSPPPAIEEYSSDKSSTKRPIFIVGMPRSGTTLVEQILASHNEVYGGDEMNTLSNLITSKLKDLSAFDANDLHKKTYLSIRQQYLESLSRFNVPESVITDKMPMNFQYIGFILTAFPEAKIIHLKRDARAICWSIYKHYFSDMGNGWAYNLDDLAGFYALYNDLIAFWHELYPNKIYDMCYEDLTTNQEEETRGLLKYCDLNWDENCLNFHTNKRAVKTASALQVRQKMYQGSSEAWKKYEVHLKPLIKALKTY